MNTTTVIDNLRIALESPFTSGQFDPGEPTFIHNLLFTPSFDSRTGYVTHHTASLKNLRIRHFHNSGNLLVDNSLHKYAQGNNYTDFPLSAIKQAISSLSEDLHCHIAKGTIKRLEYGINIDGLDALEPYKGLISYGGKEYTPMQFGGLIYGANCVRSHYNIKGYNKSLEVKRHDKVLIEPGLFRWEVAVSNMQCLHKRRPQIPIFQVNDLLQPGKLEYLSKDLLDKYRSSYKKPIIDFRSLKLNEATAIARIEHAGVRQAIQKNNKEVYKKDQRLHRVIQSKANEWPARIERLMADKCKELIFS